MLNSEIFDVMLGRLGRRSATTMRLICIQELNLAIRELERAPTKPWFMESFTTGAMTVDQDYINLPTNFLMEIEEGTFEFQDPEEGWTELKKTQRDKIRKVTANVDAALPEVYALWGNTILLGPKPDLAYNYRLDHYVRTGSVADNGSTTTNSWINEFFDYVTYKALIKIAGEHIKDRALAADYIPQFRYAEKNFITECTARQVANETLLLTDEES